MLTIEYLRSFRFGPFTYFDTLGAFLGTALLAPLLSKLFKKAGIVIPFQSWLWFVLPISVIAHSLKGVETPFTKMTFEGKNAALAVVLICALMGLRKITFLKK